MDLQRDHKPLFHFPGSSGKTYPDFPLNTTLLSPHKITGSVSTIDCPDLSISFAEIDCQPGDTVEIKSSGTAVGFIFTLRGSLNYYEKQLKEDESFLFYQVRRSSETVQLFPRDKSLKVVYILFHPTYFIRLLNPACPLQGEIINDMFKGRSTYLTKNGVHISSRCHLLLDEIRSYSGGPQTRHLFLQSRVLELLMLKLEQIEQQRCVRDENCSLLHLKALSEARKTLEDNFFSPPTISQLSKQIGLNEFSLKKGFKETFGNTIYGLIRDLRMEKAKHYLKHEGKTVSETAYLVGYKNPQHFTTAFKKKYGTLPSHFR